jgi:hypothetical protein
MGNNLKFQSYTEGGRPIQIQRGGRRLKKLVFIILLSIAALTCSPQREQVKKSMEDGAEVIINHLEPYKIKGEPSHLALEKELSVDFAGEDIGDLGIAGALNFEVDTEGNIYFYNNDKDGNLIFKFDAQGKFLHSFGHKGQGPGEIQFILFTGMDKENHLTVYDHSNNKILVFDQDGQLIKEIRSPADGRSVYPLENGNYVCLGNRFSEDRQRLDWVLSVCGPDFTTIRELITQDQDPYHIDANGYRAVNSVPFIKWKRHQGHIFAACEDRGYEIFEFDLNGRLLQIIRKEYEPAAVPADVISERKKKFERFGDKFFFPKYWLPICDFFLDDAGRIYVMTFERGDHPGEYIYDIFNPEGIFICRKSLNILFVGDREICGKAEEGRLYCFQEKPDGFREFLVYRMKWE